MIKLGEYNKLKVKRKAEFGYFLGGGTKFTKDDVLLHNRLVNKKQNIYYLGFKNKKCLCKLQKHFYVLIHQLVMFLDILSAFLMLFAQNFIVLNWF